MVLTYSHAFFVLVQLLGLGTLAGLLIPGRSGLRTVWEWVFLLQLGVVALSAVSAMRHADSVWVLSLPTLAVMVLGATVDLRSQMSHADF